VYLLVLVFKHVNDIHQYPETGLVHVRRWTKAVDTSLLWASSLFELEVDVTPRTPLFSAFAACSEGVKRCYAFRPLDEKGCCPRQCPRLPSHDIVVNLRKATPHLRLAGPLLCRVLPALAYPLQNGLAVLISRQYPWRIRKFRWAYLVDLQLCDNDFRRCDGDGDGLAVALLTDDY
jgi:hypothetical protein